MIAAVMSQPVPFFVPDLTPAEPAVHGGNLTWAIRCFGNHPEGWIDLSTGINPDPYPIPTLPAEAWTRLPDEAAEAVLCRAAAQYFGVGDPATVAMAPGSQAVIQMLPRLRPRARVAVLSPTYGEHARCWAAAGHAVAEIGDHEADGARWEVIVATNPNNPDGRVLRPGRLLDLADRLAARGGWLVVDEAFADTDPAISIAAQAGRPGLVVLRSFGKFFGLAGLRLGVALAAPDLATRVRAAFGPWAVSGPAIAIAGAAFADVAWIAATRAALAERSARLDNLLRSAGLTVIGGTALYRLADSPAAPALFERLGQFGILARPFAYRRSWLRFGLPPEGRAWERLAEALKVPTRPDRIG